MMIHSFCNTCFQQYKLIIELSDIPLVKQISDEQGHTCPCPRLCGGTINLVGQPTIDEMFRGKQLKDPLQLTGKTLFKAVNGLGLPDEIPLEKNVVESLLLTLRVTDVFIEEVHGNFYLHEIKLSGGLTVHLTHGAKGAHLFKITKERKNVSECSPG
jgi:hypothetical protein